MEKKMSERRKRNTDLEMKLTVEEGENENLKGENEFLQKDFSCCCEDGMKRKEREREEEEEMENLKKKLEEREEEFWRRRKRRNEKIEIIG
jgi:hypothetical protein